jgi:hypothetical protein
MVIWLDLLLGFIVILINRSGGEIYYNYKFEKWIIDTNSSYCFCRSDSLKISYTYCGKWFDLYNYLLFDYNIDTSNIQFFDYVDFNSIRKDLEYIKYNNDLDIDE